MPRSPWCKVLLAIVFAGAALPAFGAAAAPATPAAAPPQTAFGTFKEQVLRMNEFFDTMLPGTIPNSNIVIEYAPKLSDVRDFEFVRYPIKLRYGLGDRWELRGGLIPFSPNPFNSGADHRWGLGEGQFGVRYDLGTVPMLYDGVTLGVEARTPIGRPPTRLNDSYTHVRYGITAARSLPIPFTTLYTDISYDRVYGNNAPPPGIIRRHVTEVAPGLLYKPGEFGAFFDYRFRYFDEANNRHREDIEFKVGPIWDIPIARTADWGLPGKWQIELAYRTTSEEGYPSSNGVTARVHFKTTLKELLKQSP